MSSAKDRSDAPIEELAATIDPHCQPKPAGKIFDIVTSAVTLNLLTKSGLYGDQG